MVTVLAVIIAVQLIITVFVKYEGEHRFNQMKVRHEYARDKAKKYEYKIEALESEIDYLKEQRDMLETEFKERYKRLQERACAADIENQKNDIAAIDEIDEDFDIEIVEGEENE